jgi:hypothetical protein
MSPTQLDVSIAPGGAHGKEIEIRTRFQRTTRVPMWIAGISICLLAVSGIVAVVRAIPASYANIPNEGAPSERGTAPSGLEDAYVDDPQERFAAARDTINRRSRAWCSECGIVESIWLIERSGNVGVAGNVFGVASGGIIAAGAVTGKIYEITVHFRDGSTMVFNEATPRTWRVGSQVIVIGGSDASND